MKVILGRKLSGRVESSVEGLVEGIRKPSHKVDFNLMGNESMEQKNKIIGI